MLVAVTTSPPLWEIGRIVAVDHEEVAVRILKSNTDVSSKLDQIVPLDGEVEGDLAAGIVFNTALSLFD